MVKWILPVLFTTSLYGFVPKYKSNLEKVEHKFFSLGYDESIEGARWTYHLLTSELINGSFKRGSYFKADPKVSTGSASKYDYKGSGYDRGHLVPASDMKLSKTSMKECFYMSNMAPQSPSLNRGRWRMLETKVRYFVKKYGKLHVFTGPVFTSTHYEYINGTHIAIAPMFYKVIYSPKYKKAIAFIMKNQKLKKKVLDYAVKIDELENLTGIDFLHELNDSLENKLENQLDKKFWTI
ncbi:MAG: DNA/RNA non-specific endonuclease [Bacteriovoracaceae bacterium]|jgi:endonuclease G|nr:DNA/RNA non-specific endonuclease [Bacteriovoracaceae bacterium]